MPNTTAARRKEMLRQWSKDAPHRGDRKITISAPDTGQAQVYEKAFRLALRGRRHPKVLNLGMTPELRNLALSLGCRVVAVDMNFDMIFNLEPNIKKHLSTDNMVMRCDWLFLDEVLQHGAFDIVAGDGVIAQLTPTDMRRLIKNVAALLKPGGYFISRVDVFLPEYPILPFSELLRQFRLGLITPFTFTIAVLLYSPYRKKCYDVKKKLQKTYLFWDIMNQLAREGVITKEENEFFQARRINLSHYLLPEKELSRILRQYFTDVPVKQFMPVWPTYVGRKK